MTYIASLITFALGCGVGATELLGRYRDNPLQALKTGPALFYVFVNGLVAFVAFYVIWRIPAGKALVPGPSDSEKLFYSIIVAGLGSMALMRTAILRTKVGDQEVGIGPSVFVDTLLRVADRGVDRERARERALRVPQIMKGVPLDFAANTMPLFCLNLLQNLDIKERQEIENRITLLVNKKIPSSMKAIVAGLYLQSIVGTDVLETTVAALRDEIEAAQKEAAAKPPREALEAQLEAAGKAPPPAPKLENGGAPAKPPQPAGDGRPPPN